MRESGDPFFSHPLEVASILIDLKMDYKTIVGALLHDTAEDTSATIQEICREFGEDIANIVNGVTKLSKFEESAIVDKRTENFKKLLLSASSDIRVLIIKLADRLHNMRTLQHKDKRKRQNIAKETLEIYAPLAERTGMASIKEELQNIAFFELYPDVYNSIKNRLKTLYEASEHIIAEITNKIKALADEIHINCTITGRLKMPYSIWMKMNGRNISFEQLSDIMAFRIIVDSVTNCYHMLGCIHKNYFVVPGRFRDYISTPKNNSYQSLHTSIIGPLNKRIEIQIRTMEMHELAEFGIAAHWQYKQDLPESVLKKDLKNYQWIKNLVEMLENTNGIEEFFENSKTEMFVDQVFGITPKGQLISLPQGATVLDFAYAIHSEVGNHAVKAKINGVEVPLKTKIENGDQVEITTDPGAFPKYSWKNYVTTVKAKTSIRKVLSNLEKEQYLCVGQNSLEEAFQKQSIILSEEAILELAHACGYENSSQLFTRIGALELSVQDVLAKHNALQKHKVTTDDICTKSLRYDESPISGLLETTVLPVSCCFPVPGDRIVGLLYKGRGIEIHLENCPNLQSQEAASSDQIIELYWNKKAFNKNKKYITRIVITTEGISGILSKTADIIEQKGANILHLKIGEKSENFVQFTIDVEVSDIAHLSLILAALRCAKSVLRVDRS
jgi:GTP pyrophosphokinase